tara:strand:- start:3571 stop:4767 length:1197 start_codon:yes stop_codon:yes gene_type:complete
MLFTAGAIKMAVDVLSGGVGTAAGASMGSGGSSESPPDQSRGFIKSSLDAGKKIKDMAGYGKQLVNKRLGVLGINLSLGAILKQSQIFTGVMGSLFQILGAFVDIALAPLMPLFARGLQALAGKLPDMFELVAKVENYVKSIWAEAGGDWAGFIGMLISRSLSIAIRKTLGNLWNDSMGNANFWVTVLKNATPANVLANILKSEAVKNLWDGFVKGINEDFKRWVDQNFLITPIMEVFDAIKKSFSKFIISIKEKFGIDTRSDVQKMIDARPRISIGSQEMEEFGSPYGPNSGFNRGRVTDPALNMFDDSKPFWESLKDAALAAADSSLLKSMPIIGHMASAPTVAKFVVESGTDIYETVFDYGSRIKDQDTIDFFINPGGVRSYFDDVVGQMKGFMR